MSSRNNIRKEKNSYLPNIFNSSNNDDDSGDYNDKYIFKLKLKFYKKITYENKMYCEKKKKKKILKAYLKAKLFNSSSSSLFFFFKENIAFVCFFKKN